MESASPRKQLTSLTLLLLLCVLGFCAISCSQGAPGAKAQVQPPANEQAPSPTIEQAVSSPDLSERTADSLKWFFTALVYPAVVGGVFLLLFFCVLYITGQGQGFGYVRRTTGALLPVLFLTFMLLVTDKGDDPVRSFFLNRNPFIYILAGIILGVALVELGKRLIRTDDDQWGSIYNLFLSFMFVFLLYSIMKGFLDSLIYFLFSMIMSGGLDIVFGRPMEFETGRPRELFVEYEGLGAKSSRESESVAPPRPSKETERPKPNVESRLYSRPNNK
jgi:hypothetical protein